jgi:hypothetical protein
VNNSVVNYYGARKGEQWLPSEWMESDAGQSAIFHFTFPFATKEQPAGAYVVGYTYSTDLFTNPTFPHVGASGYMDAFVMKINE